MTTPEPINAYYDQGREHDRLSRAAGKLEFARTQELILRDLPQPPAVIYDIGGGAGIYAFWLAQLGYTVHLVDAMPLHVEQALAISEQNPHQRLASARIGDARQLDFADSSADAALLFGPLYHLTERSDRVQALREACRVLKPGGLLFAATISRFAPLIDALVRGRLADAYFVELVENDLRDGQHRNPRQEPSYFTTAYFHHPAEIQAEAAEAGFDAGPPVPIEGLGQIIASFDEVWDDAIQRDRLLAFLRTVESEPALLGATGHLLTTARKPAVSS